jgi:hypothetical protein
MAITNSISDRAKAQAKSIRQLPGWQIVQRYRRVGYTQWRIAREAAVSQSTVANTINRRGTVDGPANERVWDVLQRICPKAAK